jgi:hypothetical protein
MAVFTTGGFMKKSRFTESQIVAILKEAEGGIAITEVLRSHGISAATFYKWRSKYGGLARYTHWEPFFANQVIHRFSLTRWR